MLFTLDNSMSQFVIEISILSITGIIAVATVALRKKIFRNIIHLIENKFHIKIFSRHIYGQKDAVRDFKIQDLLAELRILSRADRSYVFQFHNGNVFSAKNQIWRLSCTHESVHGGIRPCIGELQNLLSSSVSELIYPLWVEDLSNIPGAYRVSPQNCNCANKDTCHMPHGVYLYKVSEIPAGYSKGLLTTQAIQMFIAAPLLDPNNNRVGFIGLDYCRDDVKQEDVVKNTRILCATASQISFALNHT